MKPELGKLISLSQRSLQNVGAYISISLALLAYSRFYRGKGNALYNIAFIIISSAVLLMSIRLLHLLIQQLNLYKNKLEPEDLKVLEEFTFVPRNLLYLLYIILGFTILLSTGNLNNRVH
jgi:hypothetical protein